MKLLSPIIITSRLMPGLRIGDTFISLGVGPRNGEGRTVYKCFIDLANGTEHEVRDLRSGCQGGGVQDGLASLLSFLSAAGEGDADLFPPAITEWAAKNEDEISMLSCELEETAGLVTD